MGHPVECPLITQEVSSQGSPQLGPHVVGTSQLIKPRAIGVLPRKRSSTSLLEKAGLLYVTRQSLLSDQKSQVPCPFTV